jgi:hypothetical protein
LAIIVVRARRLCCWEEWREDCGEDGYAPMLIDNGEYDGSELSALIYDAVIVRVVLTGMGVKKGTEYTLTGKFVGSTLHITVGFSTYYSVGDEIRQSSNHDWILKKQ